MFVVRQMIMCKRDLREFLLSLFFGGGGSSRRASYSRKSLSISFDSILAPSMTIFCGIKVVYTWCLFFFLILLTLSRMVVVSAIETTPAPSTQPRVIPMFLAFLWRSNFCQVLGAPHMRIYQYRKQWLIQKLW